MFVAGHNSYGQLGHAPAKALELVHYPKSVDLYMRNHPSITAAYKQGEINKFSPLPKSTILTGTAVSLNVVEGIRVKEVAAGFAHMLILTDDGEVYSCGKAEHGKKASTFLLQSNVKL